MNIWAMEKHVSIKYLLLMLSEIFNDDALAVIDNPEDDSRAIRLTHAKDRAISIYVYTYGQEADHYGVHVEYPNHPESEITDTVDIYDNISFDMLINLISVSLSLPKQEGHEDSSGVEHFQLTSVAQSQ